MSDIMVSSMVAVTRIAGRFGSHEYFDWEGLVLGAKLGSARWFCSWIDC